MVPRIRTSTPPIARRIPHFFAFACACVRSIGAECTMPAMTRATAAGHLSEETVALLVEGGLDGARLAEAEGHLAACEACVALMSEVGAALASEEKAASGTKPSA